MFGGGLSVHDESLYLGVEGNVHYLGVEGKALYLVVVGTALYVGIEDKALYVGIEDKALYLGGDSPLTRSWDGWPKGCLSTGSALPRPATLSWPQLACGQLPRLYGSHVAGSRRW
jgi:hypothetical protein